MGFSKIIPQAKAKTGVFKIATVRMRETAAFRLQLSMPSALYTLHFGAAARLNIEIGNGTDEGKLLLLPGSEGDFKPTFMRQTVIIRLPELDWPPQFKMEADDPEYRKADAVGGMLLTLPEWAWNKERQTSILKARQQVARERAAQ
ncbi:hypothetical protein [Sinorhizobium fredii]|uniref:hypothetical protein n=1 Tax=Rhizobium fredii TaxID=380 RepID=UPI0004B5F62A|nr:hypothetical protein [Sinorhizobium fredii]ASY68871.1 hypothetical protein SF83666_c14500 [Sinorhizobium fredii CCBAU 83666]